MDRPKSRQPAARHLAQPGHDPVDAHDVLPLERVHGLHLRLGEVRGGPDRAEDAAPRQLVMEAGRRAAVRIQHAEQLVGLVGGDGGAPFAFA